MQIQASPQDFGAQVGQSAEKLGSTLEQAGTETVGTAGQYQQRQNNIKIDGAYYSLLAQHNAKLAGDPSVPGDTGYFGLHGQAAVDARPALDQSLEDIRQNIRAGLDNDAQRLEFDQQSRRLAMNTTSRIDSKYEMESNNAAQLSNDFGAAARNRSVAIDPYNTENLQHQLADDDVKQRAQAALKGADPNTPEGAAVYAGFVQHGRQNLFRTDAVAMGNLNPVDAVKFLNENRGEFDPEMWRQLTDQFKTGADRQAVAAGVAGVVGHPVSASGINGGSNTGPIANPSLPPEAQKFLPALSGGEGNYASPAPTGDRSGQPIANNRYQFLRATWNGAASAAGVDVGDTSPQAQDTVAWDHARAVYKANTGGNLQADIAAGGNEAKIAGALNKVWPSLPGGSEQNTTLAQFSARLGSGPGGAPAPSSPHSPAPYGLEFTQMQTAREQAATQFPNRPDLQRQMIDGVWQDIQQTNTLQAKYEAEQAKQLRDTQQAAGNTFLKQILTDPKSLDLPALEASPLTWEQKNDLYNVAQAHLKETATDREAKTYGSGFWSAYQQVHSTDPATRINDPSQLWSRGGPNGDLSLAGIDKLTQEITSSKTPEGASNNKTVENYLSAAHVAISGHGMFNGQRDAVGEMNFARFIPSAFAEIEKEKQAGMSPAMMMQKGGALDQLVKQSTRSPQQMMRDMMGDNNPELPGAAPGTAPAAPAPPDLTTAAGISAAYKAGHFGVGPQAYDRATAELQRRGLAKAPVAVAPAPTVPTAPTAP